MKAKLILENGMIFEGKSFGYPVDTVGEVVFNTGMTGYQELLTDPSYHGQIVVMTYPLIGNYGINTDDFESSKVQACGFIVRELTELSSNFRSEMELNHFLKRHKVMGIEGIDTRALTLILRNEGTMKGVITTGELSQEKLKAFYKSYDNSNAVFEVTSKAKKVVQPIAPAMKSVALMDFGAKENIVRELVQRGAEVTLYPATTTADEILSGDHDLVFLSNGPGNPEDLTGVIKEIKKLMYQIPIGGICLGHQLLALAGGGSTTRLKFGHRGCNHPVKDLMKDKVYITSQNHGYVVDQMPEAFDVTHINVNDASIEGMKHQVLPIYSVQFHPEASPGPVESAYLFDEFLELAR
jgi:carbamoyl-phosphate synthase small subunit